MTSTIAQAQTTTVPGEQVGLAVGAPLPEGIYAVDTFTYRRTDVRNTPDTGVNIPVLVWSTPLVPFGGRVEVLVAPPTVFVFTRNAAPARNKRHLDQRRHLRRRHLGVRPRQQLRRQLARRRVPERPRR